MPRHLNLAKAARLAGVSRQELQARIRAGEISTFEGEVDVDALARLYPDVRPEESAVLERVRRLQERAVSKYDVQQIPSEARLVEEVNRLRLALDDAEVEIAAYRDMCEELRQRLSAIQARCDHDQRLVLQALLSWMLKRLERH